MWFPQPGATKSDVKFIAGVVAALLVTGGVATFFFARDPREHQKERLEAERARELEAITAVAKQDLDCPDVKVTIAVSVWAEGCGRRGRYVPRGKTYVRAPDDVPSDVPPECVTVWTREDAGAGSAREAAVAIVERGKIAGVAFPIGAFGVKGLAAFRYRETIDARVRGSVGDVVSVPCLDPDASDGVRKDEQCTLPWSAAVEVAECRQL